MNYKNYFIPFCSYILKGGCPIIAIAPHWCLKCTVLNTGKAELNARHFSPPNAWRALGDHCWWFVHLAEKSKSLQNRLEGEEDKISNCSSAFLPFFNPGQRSVRVPTEGQGDLDTTSLSSFQLPFGIIISTGKGTLLVFKRITLCLSQYNFSVIEIS